MSEDYAFEVTVKLTRGTSTDDRDTMKVDVGAHSIEELDQKVEQVRERMEAWADDLRAVQPDGNGRSLTDDQATLGGSEA